MRRNLNAFWIALFPMVLFAFACVTINIYFPAEKVESVADEIVRDVRGQKESDKKKEAPSKTDKNSYWMKTLLAFTPGAAWAQEVTAVSNPAIRTLKDRLRSNFEQMKPYYQKGMVIEGNNGYVSLGNIDSLGLKEKRDIKTLADAENQYRRQLYEEVAKALKIDPSQVNRVAEIFAKEWQKPVR